MLRKLIAEDVELLAMFEEAVTRGQGAPPGNRNAAKEERETNRDNVTVCSPRRMDPPDRGNSLSYAARRLARERRGGGHQGPGGQQQPAWVQGQARGGNQYF